MKISTFNRPQTLLLFNYIYFYITCIVKRHQIKQYLSILSYFDNFAHLYDELPHVMQSMIPDENELLYVLHGYKGRCLFAFPTSSPPFETTMAFVFGLLRGPRRHDINKGSFILLLFSSSKLGFIEYSKSNT